MAVGYGAVSWRGSIVREVLLLERKPCGQPWQGYPILQHRQLRARFVVLLEQFRAIPMLQHGFLLLNFIRSIKRLLQVFPNCGSFGVFSHSKGFEAPPMGCLGKFPSAWEKVLYRRFPQLVFTFVSQHLFPTSLLGQIPSASKRVQWRVPPTIMFVSQHLSPIRLPTFNLSPSFPVLSSKKVMWKVPP